ncbi:MAG: benzoate/H(+) symporter BenE family transporter, partial [Zavarzinia sp.]|nr:benzoate/H(+) symporter BenE family transporter [Zavarzinia sp.]
VLCRDRGGRHACCGAGRGRSPVLIQAVAGLALVGAFGGALSAALAVPAEREAALVTLLVTASGLSFGGIGAAFWGLVAGGAMWLLRPRH